MTDFHDPVPAPEMTEEDLRERRRPDGWESLIVNGTRVLCGWTNDGVFHRYVGTEEIVRHFIDTIVTTKRFDEIATQEDTPAYDYTDADLRPRHPDQFGRRGGD